MFGYTGTGEQCGECDLVEASPVCTSTPPTDCTDGQVRLMNGSEPSEGQRMGRVEICYNNTYGSVCDDFFNENAAAVVCNGTGQLNKRDI